MRRIVLDTNCLIASLSHTSRSYSVWRGLHDGRYILCVSNEILMEYQEMIGQKTTPAIAANATYIVSDDKHFKPLRNIGFPKLFVLRLMEFVERLKQPRRNYSAPLTGNSTLIIRKLDLA